MSKPHIGSCACGKVKIEVDADLTPKSMHYCHCTDCRKFIVAPFMAGVLYPKSYFDQGKIRVQGDVRRFESSERKYRTFCSECGASMYVLGEKTEIFVVFPTNFPTLPFNPDKHLFYKEKVFRVVDGLVKYEDRPTDRGGSGRTLPE
eukprot:TRINITY_DN947_c0_g1_i1.p1 TRINITY_DN947_c0_g1~~TRINITY_DN947_c0_g1_i1.p1  ORF type:complete len:147 (-),score=17.93 TRINITY_DN947_c0_g1_i1:56-496(-)